MVVVVVVVDRHDRRRRHRRRVITYALTHSRCVWPRTGVRKRKCARGNIKRRVARRSRDDIKFDSIVFWGERESGPYSGTRRGTAP